MLHTVANFAIPKIVTLARAAIVARIIGPAHFAHVSVVLISLAMLETVTQPGLSAALVQSRERDSEDLTRDVWGVLFYRGLIIAAVVFAAAPLGDELFGIAGSSPYLRAAAVIPLLRCVRSQGLVLATRELRWRALARYQLWSSGGELAAVFLCLVWRRDAYGVVVAFIIGEGLRAALSHGFCPRAIGFRPRLRRLRSMMRYGRWMWASNISIMVLSHVDKIFSGHLFGAAVLGGYHMTSRLAQMGVAEPAMVAGTYLFPKVSALYRQQPDAAGDFFISAWQLVVGAALVALLTVIAGAEWAIIVALGREWLPHVDLLRVSALAMTLVAVNAPMIAHSRAAGRPQLVTLATVIQLAVVAPALLTGSWLFGPIGLAAGGAGSLVATATVLIIGNRRALAVACRRRFDRSVVGIAVALAGAVTLLVLILSPVGAQPLVRVAVAGLALVVALAVGRRALTFRHQLRPARQIMDSGQVEDGVMRSPTG